MVLAAAQRYQGRAVCRSKYDGSYHDITWPEFAKELHAYARGLLAIGFEHGDRAAIMSPNGPEWVWADISTQACGGISVPVYHTESLANTLFILKNSGCRLLFISSPLVAGEILAHLDDLPELQFIILLRGFLRHPRIILLGDFLCYCNPALDDQLTRSLARLEGKNLASIVYTSGTSGPPRGAMLTHQNFLSNVRDCSRLFQLGAADTCISFLPLSHVFERMAGYYLMLHEGVTIAYAESIDSIPVNLVEIKPTVMISVPRLYEKMYARVMDKVVSGPWVKRRIFFTGLSLCKRRGGYELNRKPLPWHLRIITDLARRRIFEKIRSTLGGQLRFFVCGGAPLAEDVAEFFLAAGIPIYEGYGLTETSPVITVNTPAQQRLGTVGTVLSSTSVRIAEDGEILVSGPGIFQGYWGSQEQSREVLRQGWFHTGDIGQLDSDGFLSITDRKKDLIVTAGGKNIAPLTLEKRFKADKFIANALVYGDRKPYLTALLTPNFDNLIRYAELKDIDFLTHADLVSHPQILRLMQRRVEKLQQGQPGFMQVKRFTLLSREFLAENGELTQTLKIRRKVVARQFNQIVERMYLAEDHDIRDHGFCIIDPPGPKS